MKNVKIKMGLILCIVILLSSCKRNKNNYTIIPPYKYQVEYCGDKIIISKITNIRDTTSTIWKKRNGEYFDENNHLKMSLKDTSYIYYQKVYNIKHTKLCTEISAEKDSLYSCTTTFLWGYHVEEMGLVVYYDKSYQIKKIRSGGLCEYSNK